ncbi:hypothetical protein [Nonomuraea sp. NPDC050786]|uniref:hypothetical protein n=1 Tax=Nonomuraea sp. NPDC050786 TaxID=3154840 RepID=UPI0033DAAD95
MTWIGAASFAARHGAHLLRLSEMARLMDGMEATNADYAAATPWTLFGTTYRPAPSTTCSATCRCGAPTARIRPTGP